jgi:hypothetical protein
MWPTGWRALGELYYVSYRLPCSLCVVLQVYTLLHTELEAKIDHQLLYLIEYFVCQVTIFLGGGFDLC